MCSPSCSTILDGSCPAFISFRDYVDSRNRIIAITPIRSGNRKVDGRVISANAKIIRSKNRVENFVTRKQIEDLRIALGELQLACSEISSYLNEFIPRQERVKAKAQFGINDAGKAIAILIDGIHDGYIDMPFDRRFEINNSIEGFKAKSDTWTDRIDVDGKPTLEAVQEWVMRNKPAQFYATWIADTENWKEDSVEITYTPS